jgi:hypothetical protein
MVTLYLVINKAVSNYKGMLIKALLTAMLLTIIVLSLSILFGFINHVRDNIYFQNGDISVSSTAKDGNLATVRLFLDTLNYGDMTIFEYYKNQCVFIAETGQNESGVMGITENYFESIAASFSWVSEPVFDSSSILLDATFSKRIGVSDGSRIIIQIKTNDGEINAYEYTVKGIFFGNNYLQDVVAYMPITEFQWLNLQEPGFINGLRIFFPDKKLTFGFLQNIADDIKNMFKTNVSILTRYQSEARFITSYYIYIYIFYSIMAILVDISLLIICNFSLLNHYYNEFTSREKEFAALYSFGVSPLFMTKYITAEILLVLFLSLVPFFILFSLVYIVCGSLQFNSIDYSEFISLLGTNRIPFSINPIIISGSIITILLLNLLSGFMALHKFQTRRRRFL